MALLKKLPFEPPDAHGIYSRNTNFRPFMHFSTIDYKWGSEVGDWIIKHVDAVGVPLNNEGRSVLAAPGVFGVCFAMSRACLAAWLERGLIIETPRVEVKIHDMSTEVLTGILASELCGWSGESFDGTIDRYMADCIGAGEGCANISDYALKDRVIMKVWGTA
jgi:hypothetical protein